MLTGVALAWSLVQLWQASPLPFVFKAGVFNDTQARAIHLAFALFLAFTAFPARRASPRHRIPLQDWLLALAGAFSAAYLVLFHEELAGRAGAPTPVAEAPKQKPVRVMDKTGPNDPCPCGSGKKYKKCCGKLNF